MKDNEDKIMFIFGSSPASVSCVVVVIFRFCFKQHLLFFFYTALPILRIKKKSDIQKNKCHKEVTDTYSYIIFRIRKSYDKTKYFRTFMISCLKNIFSYIFFKCPLWFRVSFSF